jgi:anti-anti-sigma factor
VCDVSDLATHQRTRADGSIVLAAVGEVDVLSRDAFADATANAIAGRPLRLVLDLTLVTFMDSTGVGVLVHGYRDAVTAGVSFLVQPSPFVMRLLGVAGLLHEIPLDPPAPPVADWSAAQQLPGHSGLSDAET